MNSRWGNPQNGYQQDDSTDNIIRYFIHGVPFALLSIFFVYAMSFALRLVTLGDMAELLTLMLAMFTGFLVMVGSVNVVTAELVWGIRSRRSLTSVLGQGFLFTILLFFIDPFLGTVLFAIAATLILDLAILFVSFVLLSLVGGYLGRNVAMEFVGEQAGKEELASVHDRGMTCPHCGIQLVVGSSRADAQGGMVCPQCGHWLQVTDAGPSID